MSREIILHCFQWRLQDIISQLKMIKECGYTAIQISPVQPCKDGNEWWCDYQPTGFRIGNRHGSKEDLIELCNEATKLGIRIIVDVVLRHCAGTNDGKLVPHEDVDSILRDNKYFWTNAQNTTNHKDRWWQIHGAFGMPMLDYNNWDLQNIFISFLDELTWCGVSGFRVDMGKHFALKEEGSVFWERVFGRYSNLFNYAECLECDRHLLDLYARHMGVISDYHSPSDKSKLITYIMTHDTEETWGFTKGKNDDMIINEWRYLLQSNKESHVLFYTRSFSDLWKTQAIKDININNN